MLECRGLRFVRIFRRQYLLQSIAELRDRVAQGEELIKRSRSGEMKRVTGVVHIASEYGGPCAAQRKRDRQQVEAVRGG